MLIYFSIGDKKVFARHLPKGHTSFSYSIDGLYVFALVSGHNTKITNHAAVSG